MRTPGTRRDLAVPRCVVRCSFRGAARAAEATSMPIEPVTARTGGLRGAWDAQNARRHDLIVHLLVANLGRVSGSGLWGLWVASLVGRQPRSGRSSGRSPTSVGSVGQQGDHRSPGESGPRAQSPLRTMVATEGHIPCITLRRRTQRTRPSPCGRFVANRLLIAGVPVFPGSCRRELRPPALSSAW